MAVPQRIFALNLGMQTVSLSEFHANANGGITLQSWKQEELIADPAADVTRPAQLAETIGNLRKSLNIPARAQVHYGLPSQSVFTRFVKLPGQTADEVASIIGFEAQQNVPFPIDEVVWDYQIMGESRDNNWDVVLVAIKADQLDEINTAVTKGGFKSATIDVAPMALYNAFRYNYSQLSGCSLLIDIGARTTNLIFIEDQRVFSRSIPVGGSTISAALAREFKEDITIAEKLKVERGFVGLGGAYADPDDATDAKVSKVIRNTMTRLHAEIARSISFYRQNQAGNAPVRAFLCGGTVSLPYMVEFFSEKLQMPIEYFNPLRNVTVANIETATALGDKAHTLGEVVGYALRSFGNTPLEIGLRPQSVVREQSLSKRKPFLVLATICLLLALTAWWLYLSQAAAYTQVMLDSLNAETAKLKGIATKFDALDAEQKKLEAIAAPLAVAAIERTAWIQILDELGAKLPERFIWITELQPLSNNTPVSLGDLKAAANTSPAPRSNTPASNSGTPMIDALQIRGLYLADPPDRMEAPRIVDQYVDQLQKSSLFKIDEKDKAKVVVQRTTPDGQSWAYSYTIVLPLRNPIALP